MGKQPSREKRAMAGRQERLDFYRKVMATVQAAKGTESISDLAKAAGMEVEEFRRGITGLRVMGVDIGGFQRFFIRGDIFEMAKEFGFEIKPKTKDESKE